MPEISDVEFRQFVRYQILGSPDEVTKKIGDLEADNKRQRDELRELKPLLPKDSEAVVSKADAARLDEYKKLGKPEEVLSAIEAGKVSGEKLAQAERLGAAQKFVAAAGLAAEAAATLIALPELATASFEITQGKVRNAQNMEVDGDVPVLRVGTEALTFAQAQEKFPALKGLRPAGKQDGRPPVPFVAQHGEGGNKAPHTVYERIRESRKPATADKPQSKPITERLGMTRAL